MAALANLILAIAIAILLPLLQYIAPAPAVDAPGAAVAAAQAPAAPIASNTPASPAAPKVCVWTATCSEDPAETRSVQILIEKVRAESPCKARVLELAEPAAPARFILTTT